MSKRDIDSLLNRGKHVVQQYITNGCFDPSPEKSLEGTNLVEKHLQSHDHRNVHYVIDHLFDFRNNYTAEELVEWIKYIVGGRRLPNNFAKEVKKYDTSSKCGLVWTTNFVAYRCRTCAISLCMSLCIDCFLSGDHEGHDFNMFRSQAGGACDCGDPFVMKESGFCSHHRPKSPEVDKNKLPPNSLLCMANEVVPRLLYYLVLYLRDSNFQNNKKADALLSDVLIYLNDLGTLMQDIICKALTDPELYKNSLYRVNKEGDLDYQHRIRTLAENYTKAVNEIQLSSIIPDVDTTLIADYSFMNEIESFNPVLVHKTFLDEIIFWTILNEFPSNLITFLLKMLPDEEYKREFAESFVKHYFRISMLILHPPERFIRNADRDIYYNKLAKAIVHVSVQLFSNENLALLLCDQLKLLYIIIISLKYAIEGNRKDYWGILVLNLLLYSNDKEMESNLASDLTIFQWESSFPRVVNCDHSILRLHRFWPIVSDLNNLFTHERVALFFLADDMLIDLWLEFIMSFQAMNLNRKMTVVDDENANYKSAYLSELEICASQMWTLISHLKDENTKSLTINFIKHSLKWLQTWMSPLKLNVKEIDVERCSFHLPLHRYYSMFMHHAVTIQNVEVDILLPIDDQYKMKCLIVHPLQTLIAFQHISSGLWVNNGIQIKTQAINYMQPHFCNSTIDSDVFLIQQVSTRINPDEFVDMFATSYGLKQYMYIYPIASTPMDQEKLIPFLENAFTLLAQLVNQHINLGPNNQGVTRKEMVTLLSISEKTHSQIQDLLPYKCGHLMNNSFIEILTDIAEYKSPEVEASGSLVQGYFYPKNHVWEHEYDPLFILYRNSYRRDFQTSLQRFAAFARQTGRYTSSSLPWPPFRVPPKVDKRFIDPHGEVDSDDEAFMNVINEQLTIGEVDGANGSSNNATQSTSQPSSSQNNSRKSSRSRVSFSKTKPLRFEFDVEESFLSLLLKLYSKFNGKRDSFKPDSAGLASFDLTSRIGDGPYFIGCLLKRFILICAKRLEFQQQMESIDKSDNVTLSSETCFEAVVAIVDKTRRKIWPNVQSNTPEPSSNCQQMSTDEQQPSKPSETNMVVNEDVKPTEFMDIDNEELERVEKKKRALELKQKIMNKFRTMQDEFIQNNKEIDDDKEAGKDTEKSNPINVESGPATTPPSASSSDNSASSPSSSSSSSNETQVKYEPKSYHCVICGVAGYSTLDRSFVQMVLFQSTSVMGNAQANTLSEEISNLECTANDAHQASSSNAPNQKASLTSSIPITEDEYNQFSERKIFANYFENRVDAFYNSFALDSWLSSFNIGWCGGVHAQSCGHLMHMDCYQSYITSVYQNREANELIEYSCPLCRKTANSVLPIIPNFANLYAVVKSRNNNNPQGAAMEVLDLLSNGDKSRLANTTEDESKFLKVLAMTIEDVMKATEPQYRNIRVEPSPQSLFLFLSSISRTNLEYNILLWRDNMLRPNQHSSCFVNLFQALSLNAKLVLPFLHFTRLWSQITGIDSDDDATNLIPYEKQVPLLMKDPSAILLQFLYALPFNIDKAYFISITQALLNLNFIQALVLIVYQMPTKQRMEISSKGYVTHDDGEMRFDSIYDYIAFIMNNFESSQNSLTADVFSDQQQHLTDETIQFMIAKICLPFLRISSMLVHMLYQQSELPDCRSIVNCNSIEEFTILCQFLGIDQSQTQSNSFESTKKHNELFYQPYINWIDNDPTCLINMWYREFDKFVQINTMSARKMVREHYILSHRPQLLQLPTIYEQLFMFYHKRTCLKCHKVPKDASICLICGRLICIRDSCCRTGSVLEGVTHSKKCGAGTAIYLAINSSSIIVIRGRKACIWGSVYLDEFGEEDRDLKRGKPLFLCKERYKILEQQWLTHSFSHINKKWVFHKDSL
ncbi:E3 ubiquitin-protein ligase ubr3 [Blomia tropicalis]|nr:E3 ubiquitin-protein ligase ubr3 [Blomia tropicalis]